MKAFARVVIIFTTLLAHDHVAFAADEPADLIVGKWKIRQPAKEEFIEFLKDGTGTITKTTPEENIRGPISWKITDTYGNACVIVIGYVTKDEKPLPKEAKPMTWLVAFDGKDNLVTQLRQNEITIMVRQKSTPKAISKIIPE